MQSINVIKKRRSLSLTLPSQFDTYDQDNQETD